MQSHEERADEMLRMMGGSLSVAEQRNVLRRLILAEDKVVGLQAEVSTLRSAFEHLERDHGCKAYPRAPVVLRCASCDGDGCPNCEAPMVLSE